MARREQGAESAEVTEIRGRREAAEGGGGGGRREEEEGGRRRRRGSRRTEAESSFLATVRRRVIVSGLAACLSSTKIHHIGSGVFFIFFLVQTIRTSTGDTTEAFERECARTRCP